MVPILDRPNYHIWSIQMGNILCAKGLWLYVQGRVARPTDTRPGGTQPTPPDTDNVAVAHEKQLNWDTKNTEANGLVMLKVFYSLHRQQGATSYHT